MFDYQPRLEGPLVALRPVAADDWPALYALASDPALWALHPQSNRWQEAVFRPYFEEGLASGGALTAIDRETGDVVGWSRFSPHNALPGEIEIGWTFIGRPWWGRGHNSGMKALMLAHAFRFVDTVIFRIGETNLRSRRAVEKLGATLTDRTETVAGPNGGEVVHLVYAVRRPTS